MDAAANPASVVVWGGFVLAFLFGAIAAKANFCTMGAVSDVVNMGHWGRMRMWLLAIAVAIVGANLLGHAGLVDLSKSVYQRPTLNWLSLLLGGALFGVGMSLAGGCANKNLIRVGGGSVRSLVVLTFLAISAYMTLKGLFGQWRASWLDPVSLDLARYGLKDQSLASMLANASGLAPKTALLAVTAAVGKRVGRDVDDAHHLRTGEVDSESGGLPEHRCAAVLKRRTGPKPRRTLRK